MELGIALPPGVDSWKVVARAEKLGITRAWFFDSPNLYADVFVVMAMAAMNTSSIRLGTGVFVPSSRPAPTTAAALATLNAIAPGRLDIGVGTGNTARDCQGLRPMRVDSVERYLNEVRGLLSGEVVEVEVEGALRKMAQIDGPAGGFTNNRDEIRFLVSALGPKTRRLTAEMADGWLTVASTWPKPLEEMKRFRDDCAEAGRDFDTIERVILANGCVLREGERADSDRAIALAGPAVATSLHTLITHRMPQRLSDETEALRDAYRRHYESFEPADAKHIQLHRGHCYTVRPDDRTFISADLVQATTYAAPVGELADRMRALDEAGYDHFAISVNPGYEDEAMEQWAEVFERI